MKKLQHPCGSADFRRIIFGVALPILLLWPAAARADRRAYAQTFEAVTAPRGELGITLWNTYAGDGEFIDGPASKGYRGMLALEYGITSRWDIALYNLLDLVPDPGQSGYAGFKIESRLRLVPAGDWFIDPVLYLEYQRLFRGDAQQKGQVKLILGKDMEAWNVSTNLAFELQRALGGNYTPGFEYALGVSREILRPALKLGAEVFGKVEKPVDADSVEAFVWAGPAISWVTTMSGLPRGFWITLAGGHGLTSESQSWYARAIVSFQF